MNSHHISTAGLSTSSFLDRHRGNWAVIIFSETPRRAGTTTQYLAPCSTLWKLHISPHPRHTIRRCMSRVREKSGEENHFICQCSCQYTDQFSPSENRKLVIRRSAFEIGRFGYLATWLIPIHRAEAQRVTCCLVCFLKVLNRCVLEKYELRYDWEPSRSALYCQEL